MKKNILQLIISILTFVIWCNFGLAADEKPDYWPTKGWRTSTPENQGIDSEKLVQMLKWIDDYHYSIDSITIIRNGYMVLDIYFHPFRKGHKHVIFSCTKSITSTLVGIAIDKGYIEDEDQPLLKFFPERAVANLSDQKKAITLEHILTMHSGLNTRDNISYRGEGMKKMKKSKDWIQYALDLPMADEPGNAFEYSNIGSFLLTAILHKTTKMNGLDFAKKHLFHPLGITNVSWWSSPQGISIGSSDMMLTPHDMAKIGFLYLNQGSWENKQIVSEEWVEFATFGQVLTTWTHISDQYGYQFWVDSKGYYMAVGFKGQFIIVVPKKNMVIAITSSLDPGKIKRPIRMLNKFIIPAAVSSKPLSENPVANTRLSSIVAVESKDSSQRFIETSEKEDLAERGVFIRRQSPSFQFKYPKELKKLPLSPGMVFKAGYPKGSPTIEVSISPLIPDLNISQQLSNYAPMLADLLELAGTDIEIISNKPIDSYKEFIAYQFEISWKYQGQYNITTIGHVVAKEKKAIFFVGHTSYSIQEALEIFKTINLSP